MKKVEIYLKSGQMIEARCSDFVVTYNKETGEPYGWKGTDFHLSGRHPVYINPKEIVAVVAK